MDFYVFIGSIAVIIAIILLLIRFRRNEVTPANYNIGNTTIEQMYFELTTSINSPTSKNIKVFGKDNKLISLNIERQKLLLEQIQRLRATNSEYNKLKVEEILSGESMQYLLSDRKLDFEYNIQIKEKELKLKLARLDDERILADTKIKADIALLDKIIIANESSRIDNELKKSKSDTESVQQTFDNTLKMNEFNFERSKEAFRQEQEKLMAQHDRKLEIERQTIELEYKKSTTEIIKQILKLSDISKMSQAFQAYLFSLVFKGNINLDALSKADLENILQDEMKKEKEAQVRKVAAQANKEEYEANKAKTAAADDRLRYEQKKSAYDKDKGQE